MGAHTDYRDTFIPPWEVASEHGYLTAFFRTAGEVMRAPDAFFRQLSAEGPVLPAIGFWAGTSLPPLVLAGISANTMMERVFSLTMSAQQPVQLHIPWWVLTVVAPIVQFGMLLGGLVVVHILLRMLGEARGGWSGTYRAAGYASAPALIGLIPVLGAPVAGIWAAILQFMALVRVHRTTSRSVILAYLLPLLAALVIGVGLIAIVATLFLARPLPAAGVP